jgi:hypothetical protein
MTPWLCICCAMVLQSGGLQTKDLGSSCADRSCGAYSPGNHRIIDDYRAGALLPDDAVARSRRAIAPTIACESILLSTYCGPGGSGSIIVNGVRFETVGAFVHDGDDPYGSAKYNR